MGRSDQWYSPKQTLISNHKLPSLETRDSHLLYLDEQWKLDPECLVGNDVSARGMELKLHQ